MILGQNQKFASPEEALAHCTARRARVKPFASPEEAVLAHFGVKGMRWGVRKERQPGAREFGEPYSSADGLGHKSKNFELKKQRRLRVDHSNGFADVRPANGFQTTRGKLIHDEMINSLKALREEYPGVTALKIELVPASHLPIPPGRSAQAAVMHTKPGEVIVTYNDRAKDFSPRKQKRWEKWIPGMAYEGYVGRHEMGHVLAISGNLTPPCWDMAHAKSISKRIDQFYALQDKIESQHKAAFARHGFSFEELSKLSPYAATAPSEAYAELRGQYSTPELRSKMTPEMQRKAKAMFDEAGGKR